MNIYCSSWLFSSFPSHSSLFNFCVCSLSRGRQKGPVSDTCCFIYLRVGVCPILLPRGIASHRGVRNSISVGKPSTCGCFNPALSSIHMPNVPWKDPRAPRAARQNPHPRIRFKSPERTCCPGTNDLALTPQLSAQLRTACRTWRRPILYNA